MRLSKSNGGKGFLFLTTVLYFLLMPNRAFAVDCVIRTKDGKAFQGRVERIPGGFRLRRGTGAIDLFFHLNQVRKVVFGRPCTPASERHTTPVSSAIATKPKQATLKPKRYHGEPLDFFVRDAPLADVLRTLAEQAGLSLMIPPGFEGTVNLDLHRVPWDQILDLLARMHHFTYRLEDHILIVMKKSG